MAHSTYKNINAPRFQALNCILLSGGSGKRLWPLSNEVRSKQFLQIFKRDDGSYESMLQRMYRMLRAADDRATIVLATAANQIPSIDAQLGGAVDICAEPSRRNTFPAIALSSAYLHDIRRVNADEPVIVCPVDPYVEDDYFRMLKEMDAQVRKDEANLVLMGIEPTYPSAKYGYIIPGSNDLIASVASFKEKPDEATAAEYIANGALWNSGVFAYKLGYILDMIERKYGNSSYQWILDHYDTFENISFDYAVLEHEESMQSMRFSGQWKDLGTWNTLTEAMSEEVLGNATAADCQNTHVINELPLPLLALGVSDLAIAATPDGILVTDKMKSSQMKDYVSEQRPMYEQRVWGDYKVLDYQLRTENQNFLTKHMKVNAGQSISYQCHRHRTEMWIFIEGSGELVVDDESRMVGRGDYIYIPPGMKHAVHAYSELHIIEVQLGDKLMEEDIERFDWNWCDR